MEYRREDISSLCRVEKADKIHSSKVFKGEGSNHQGEWRAYRRLCGAKVRGVQCEAGDAGEILINLRFFKE